MTSVAKHQPAEEQPAKPAKLTRYKDLAVLLYKFGRSDIAKNAGLNGDLMGDAGPVGTVPEAEELAKTLERMGPTFVKLGQLLSTRADLLPPVYLEALTRLQDNVTPIPFTDIQRVVQEELHVKISSAFGRFDEEPLAAASLGQVHRAELRDGRAVVVKVQRPGIREQVAEDLEILAKVAGALDKHTQVGERYHFAEMVEEFKRSLIIELDYRKEASNLAKLGKNLAEYEKIVVPQPVLDYTTSRVLTMDYIDGTKVTDVSPLTLQETDREGLASELFRAYLKQIFVDGFFHADPHPGNVFLTTTPPVPADARERAKLPEPQIALLDVGMVGRLAPRLQEHLLQMIVALSEGRSDETADIALRLAERSDLFEEKEFRRRIADVVGQQQDATLEELQIGRTFMTLAHTAGETGVRLPPELTMLGKTLLNLDLIGRTLAPEFDPNKAIRRNAAQLLNRRLLKSLSPGNLMSTVIEAKDLITRMPARINRLLDAAADNKLGVKVDTGIDATQLMVGLQKVANRIAVGLILGALIVGASFLMQIPTNFRIFGYPGLAMFFFLLAAGGGIGLLVVSLSNDIKAKWAARRMASKK
jgi:ubiquinone biosynthesis protein